MADQDQDATIKDENLEDVVETPVTGEDENLEDKDSHEDAEDTEDNEEGNEDDSDGNETDEDEDPKFEKRFTQITGDTPEEYIPNLEEAYRHSSTEAQRLALANKDLQSRNDAIIAAATRDPELAAKLNEAMGDNKQAMVDPALLEARSTMEDRMTQEFNEFKELHPEFDSDPTLQEQVLDELSAFGEAARRNGKILPMKEGLKKAWLSLGREYNAPKAPASKEEIATAAKRTAKSRTNSKGKKPQGGSKLTAEQIAFGKKFNLSPEQLEANYK